MRPVLILASASPNRKILLEALGFPFEVAPSRVDEEAHPEADPERRACQLSCLKAREVAGRFPGRYVIGCDTLVVDPQGGLLEKPADEADARSMLRRQSGGVSVVHSGLCVIAPDASEHHGISSSRVHFRALEDRDVDWWISTGLWEGRSGSFQIDGPGQLMISRIEGDFTGIVGLPVYELGLRLRDAGYPLF